MDEEEGPERHLLSLDSIKMMAESVGIAGLQEEAGKRLAEDLEFRLKEVRYRDIVFLFVALDNDKCSGTSSGTTVFPWEVY